MKMKKALQFYFILKVILTVSAATDEEFVVRYNGDDGELTGNIQPLQAAVDENKQLNDDDGENVQLNEADTEKKQLYDETPYGEVRVLKHQDIPNSNYKKRGKNQKNKKPSPLKFKYAMDKKDEPGFDLTPEEMKKFKIWKDGIIPYYIDIVSFGDKVLRDKIRNDLHMVNSITSINFVELPGPPSNDKERWVFFMNRRGLLGCADHAVNNFTNEGVQKVVLGYDCLVTRGEIAEAVMSIVGVPAQHNAPDRNKYIKVNMENIMPDKKYLFEKLNDNEWLFHELDYDFNSITHYDIHKHSANGRATIEPKKTCDYLNPATTFSANDLHKIKQLYNFNTKNKKMQTPVCKKLFKISNKVKPGSSMSKRLNPKKKPTRYLGLAVSGADKFKEKTENEKFNKPNDENNDQNADNNDEEEISTKYDDEISANDGEKHGNGGDKENEEDETYTSGIIVAKNPVQKDTMNQLQGYKGKRPKKGLKGRTPRTKKAESKIDLIHQLSDYGSTEEHKRVGLNLKGKLGPQKSDPLLTLSDYQTDEGGM